MTESDPDHRRAARIAHSESLSEFEEQRRWYSDRAGIMKNRSQRIDLAIIVLGALLAALPVLRTYFDLGLDELLVSLFGAAIVIGQGAQRIFRYSEIWPEYRRASERMKSEWRAFVNTIPPYDTEDEDEARRLYASALEAAIAEEKKLFFDSVRKAGKPVK